MSTYTGEVKFILDTGNKALVEETLSGSSIAEGYKFVKSSDLSSKSIGDTITYSYDAGSASNDGHDITIS
jgi:hypothetical protein